MSIKRQLATFTLDGLLFGIDVATVQEVLRYQPMTVVPLAPKIVGGLINLRGKIVAAIDLRLRLDLPARDPGLQPMNMVLRAEEGAVSLLVDTIGEVVTVDEDAFEPPPDTMTAAARGVVEGVYKLPEGLLLSLDWKAAVTSPAGAHNGDSNNGRVTR
jgi:purine-binding chemotaxis protein CheW